MAAKGGWTSQRLNEATASGKIYPLYYLYGDETFLIEEAANLIVNTAIGEGMRDFNLNTYYGGETEPAQIRDAAETLPMMSQVRVVVVRDADDLKDKEWELLLPLLEEPVPTTALVCTATKADKRKKYVKLFGDKGVLVEFKRPYDNQIPEWIKTLAKRRGLKLNNDAVHVFHDLVGSNLQDIDGELMKLGQYLGDRKQATPDDIVKAVARVRIDSVFDLTDAIGRGDRMKALDCLGNLLVQGQSEVGILALISRQVRILKLMREGLKDGLSGQRLSSRAGVSPFFLDSYLGQAKAWSDRKIDLTFKVLLDTDRALKSSPVASHLWLENLIIQTCA